MISSNGFDNVQWFIGIVENEYDATNHGRVQVRVFGIHPTYDSQDFDPQYLPWAPVINANNGTPIPANGDWVFGFFIDGRDAQHPFVIGTVPGFNGQLPAGTGFSDTYKAPSKETIQSYGEPPLHPAQSNESLETTQVVLQNASLIRARSATNELSEQQAPAIKEPPVPSAGASNENMVWRSRSSESYIQVSEGDEEFMIISHESGSHILIDGGGNVKIKSFGDSYSLSEGNSFESSVGTKTISIEGNYALKCKSATLEVNGDFNHTVKGNYNLNVGGKFGVSIGQSFELASQRISMETVSEHFNLKSKEKVKIESGSTLSLKSGNDLYITSSGKIQNKSSSDMFSTASNVNVTASSIAMDADPIHLASGEASSATETPETIASPKLNSPVEQTISLQSNEVETTPGSTSAASIDDIDEG